MKSWIGAGIFTLFLSGVANAALITADFRTESNLPGIGAGLPLVYESLNQSIGAGFELDNSHFIENPSSWGGGVVWLDFDPTTNILTLDSQDNWDFRTFDAWLSNIIFSEVGEVISGITMLTNNLVDVALDPILSFSDNSIHISYNYMPNTFNFTGGTATFQIQTSLNTTPVPAPASFGLLALGLLGLRLRKRN